MAKLKVTNESLQVLNLLVKEGTSNKGIQLLPKEDIILDKTSLTDQIKRLKDLGHISITPYTESVIL